MATTSLQSIYVNLLNSRRVFVFHTATVDVHYTETIKGVANLTTYTGKGIDYGEYGERVEATRPKESDTHPYMYMHSLTDAVLIETVFIIFLSFFPRKLHILSMRMEEKLFSQGSVALCAHTLLLVSEINWGSNRTHAVFETNVRNSLSHLSHSLHFVNELWWVEWKGVF